MAAAHQNIDQFEELFTLVEDEAVRGHFLASLVTAVLDPTSRLRLVITLRADFMDRPLQYVDFGEILRQRLLLVTPLTPDELTQVITRPAQNLGISMTPELVATIIQDVGDQPGMLPLLQYALTELFEQRQTHLLTLDSYRQTGGVTGALARRADELYNSLAPTDQEATRQLFLRLITLGEGASEGDPTPDTRKRVLLTELEALAQIVNRQSKIINLYGRHRLLTFDYDPISRSPTVEVAHEALLREWPRLRGWLRDGREDIRRQRELARAAHRWQANNQDESFLLHGGRLASFEGWLETTSVLLTADEHAYLQASIAARDARQAAEETRRQRELETAQQLAREQTQRAEEQAQAAQALREQLSLVTSHELALAAMNNLVVDPERSLLLARKALLTSKTQAAEEALRQSLQVSRLQNFFSYPDNVAVPVEFFHPNGKIAASIGKEKVHMWKIASGEILIELPIAQGSVSCFAHDGSTIAVGDTKGWVTFFDSVSGNLLQAWQVTEVSILGMEISPDGSLLAVGNELGQVIVCEIDSNNELYLLQVVEDGKGYWFEFNPDGSKLLTRNREHITGLWESRSGNLSLSLGPAPGTPYVFAFTPDGTKLYTPILGNGAITYGIYIWDVSETAASTSDPESILRNIPTYMIRNISFARYCQKLWID